MNNGKDVMKNNKVYAFILSTVLVSTGLQGLSENARLAIATGTGLATTAASAYAYSNYKFSNDTTRNAKLKKLAAQLAVVAGGLISAAVVYKMLSSIAFKNWVLEKQAEEAKNALVQGAASTPLVDPKLRPEATIESVTPKTVEGADERYALQVLKNLKQLLINVGSEARRNIRYNAIVVKDRLAELGFDVDPALNTIKIWGKQSEQVLREKAKALKIWVPQNAQVLTERAKALQAHHALGEPTSL